MTRRRASPLAAQRLRTQPRVLRPPPTLVVDPTLPDEEAPVAAYCPVRHRYEDVKMCESVDCGRCQLLEKELEERAPDHTWVCSRCTAGLKMQPFWKDGACEACGYESPVLMLAVPR